MTEGLQRSSRECRCFSCINFWLVLSLLETHSSLNALKRTQNSASCGVEREHRKLRRCLLHNDAGIREQHVLVKFEKFLPCGCRRDFTRQRVYLASVIRVSRVDFGNQFHRLTDHRGSDLCDGISEVDFSFCFRQLLVTQRTQSATKFGLDSHHLAVDFILKSQ